MPHCVAQVHQVTLDGIWPDDHPYLHSLNPGPPAAGKPRGNARTTIVPLRDHDRRHYTV
jgi:hypothetical protein